MIDHAELFKEMFPDSSVIKKSSIKEDSYFRGPLEVEGGNMLFFLDNSTGMCTGTFKAIDAVLVRSVARLENWEEVVFASSSNTGVAFTTYLSREGVKTHMFIPSKSKYKCAFRNIFEDENHHLYTVDAWDREVKTIAREFSREKGFPFIPDPTLRMEAEKVLAAVVLEREREENIKFDYFAQAVSAGFGPIGFYKGMEVLEEANPPSFIAVQQSEVSPVVNAFLKGHSTIEEDDIAHPNLSAIIEPTLFNTAPEETYPHLKQYMDRHGAIVTSIDRTAYSNMENEVLELLPQVGLTPTRFNGRIIERAGIIAVMGVLDVIRSKKIKNKHILIHFTGGILDEQPTSVDYSVPFDQIQE